MPRPQIHCSTVAGDGAAGLNGQRRTGRSHALHGSQLHVAGGSQRHGAARIHAAALVHHQRAAGVDRDISSCLHGTASKQELRSATAHKVRHHITRHRIHVLQAHARSCREIDVAGTAVDVAGNQLTRRRERCACSGLHRAEGGIGACRGAHDALL